MLLNPPDVGPRAIITNRGLRRREIRLAAGPFDIQSVIGDPRRRIGLLLADGLITAHLEAGRGQVAWLLGAGDLIRPWEMDDIPLGQSSEWRALTDARMLLIERGDDPDAATIERVLSMASRTTHWLLASSLIFSSPSITERLLLLFTLYAERWGKVTPEGVRLELPLTHELLGKLCGARRPTVTLAISSMERQGSITRPSRDVWLLHQYPGVSDVLTSATDYEPNGFRRASMDGGQSRADGKRSRSN